MYSVLKRILCSLCSVSLPSVKTWMEETNNIPYKNPFFFMTTKSVRIFVKMKIISSGFIILKQIQITSQFWKLLMLKVRL